jgi:hypothetical protein
MILLWATRGRSWGFRFLPVAGSSAGADPLPLYERAFAGHEGEAEGCWDTDGLLAVRILDPEGRRDEAGRTIPHEIVLEAAQVEHVATPADAIEHVWPLLAGRYAGLWDGPGPCGPS